MSQNRAAPAYQEYAASILSQLSFRTMTLQDRGLLFTMRLECWVNVRLPQSHDELAKVLGLPIAEVASSYSAVMPFFDIVDGFIISPELENYRAHLAERRFKQSNGGKLGSSITNKKRNRPGNAPNDPSTTSSTLKVVRRGRDEFSVQPDTEKQNQRQSAGRAVVLDPFVAEYEAAEHCSAEDYERASGGR